MIKFPCKCCFQFEVPEEMAGNPLQCPRCMLLNEVPLLSDLADLKMMAPSASSRSRWMKKASVAELSAPSPRRHDDAGEIDMRQT
jgi:hypothetical protein